MRFLLVFLDGVGIGTLDTEVNPFALFELPALSGLFAQTDHATASHAFLPIDATLGVEGLPQSGTGQASLFTGRNCAQIVGRHFGPYPHSASREVLAEHNIFRQIESLPGKPVPATAFANAYPPPFFAYVKRSDRWTVTTRCCLEAGVHIRSLDDLAAGNAVAADLTGARLASAGFDVSPVTEADAASALVRLAADHQLTVFEYFLTDKAGHSQSFAEAEIVLRSLDDFFRELLPLTDREKITLLVTSDHGNLEDLSTKTHTRNPVPLVARGPHATAFSKARSILDVAPTIVSLLRDQSSG